MIGSIISAAATLVGSAVSSLTTAQQNKKNREWQDKMYARQLADERESWTMQNDYNEEMYNKYNSPAAQSRQMMAAGINPDMQELSGNTISPAGAVGSSSVPSVSGNNPIDFVGAFMNIAEMINSVRSRELDNEIKEAELQKLSESHAMDYLVKNYDVLKSLNDNEGTNTMGESFEGSKSSSQLWKYFKAQGLSKRSAKLAARYVKTTDITKVKDEYYKRKHGMLSSRKSSITDMADPYFKDDDDDMISALNEFLTRKDDLDRILVKANKKKAKYDSDYYGSKNGATDAKTEERIKTANADIQDAAAASSDNDKELNKEINDFIDSLDSEYAKVFFRLLYHFIDKSSIGLKKGGFSFGL